MKRFKHLTLSQFLYKVIYTLYNLANRGYRERITKKVLSMPPVDGVYHGPAREEQIILSLTSFPPRFPQLPTCLHSLLQQTMKPDRIIVWLGSDTTQEDLTAEMRSYEQYGVEFRFVQENLRPHKKYYYAMQEFPNAAVVTVDDDLVYPPDVVESLWKKYLKYPGVVCARRVHLMKVDQKKKVLPYSKWLGEYILELKPSMKLLATTGAGCLFPPGILPKETFQKQIIQQSCFGADDIWLKMMELLADIPVVWVPNRIVMPLTIKGTQEMGLYKENADENKNDIYLQQVLENFPALEGKFEW